MKVLDKQFEMLGVKIRFSDIPDSGVVSYTDGKKEKKDYWYNVYKFTEKQEKEWKEWAREELRRNFCADEEHLNRVFMNLELRYGFVIRYKKEGELF